MTVPGQESEDLWTATLKAWRGSGSWGLSALGSVFLDIFVIPHHLLTSFDLLWESWRESLILRSEWETERPTRMSKGSTETSKQPGNSVNDKQSAGSDMGESHTERLQIEIALCLQPLPPGYCAVVTDVPYRCLCGASSSPRGQRGQSSALQLLCEENFLFLWLFSTRTWKKANS